MRWSEAEYARYIQNTEQNTSSPKPINTLLKKLGLMVYVLTVKRKPIIIVS